MEYKICQRCVMDTSDIDIEIFSDGTCNHCRRYYSRMNEIVQDRIDNRQLKEWAESIKISSRGKYDCLIGVSGGVDSTYVAFFLKKLGLNPLAIHLDNGWNSELAVKNIQVALERLDIDLITYIIDWEEFKSLQLAFLRASIPGMEIPTDHAITAILFQTAKKYNLNHIVLGANMSSELIMPKSWSEVEGQRDWRLISNVNKIFGGRKLKTYPHFSRLQYYWYLGIDRIRVHSILDTINYRKDDAMRTLQEELDWKYYGGKHYESIYTRFTQGYIQPVKFKFDKRRAHYSNLICRGDISRESVIEILEKSPYPNDEMLREDIEYFKSKLSLSDEQYQEILSAPLRSYKNYNGYHNNIMMEKIHNIVLEIHRALKKMGLY